MRCEGFSYPVLAFLLGLIFSAPFAARSVTIGVVGNYGVASMGRSNIQHDVTTLVKSWNPDFIITVGDNNHFGEASTIDTNIGQFYQEYIYPYAGIYGPGGSSNRFFPCLGNNDWFSSTTEEGAVPYREYFTLPGNERYYNYRWGDVELFAVHSESFEPDGNTSSSIQGQWLRGAMTASTATWKIVYMHSAAYSSGDVYGPNANLQWPFADWGAHVVLSGNEHLYERLVTNGIPYLINGLGGRPFYPFAAQPMAGSEARFNADYGALRIDISSNLMSFRFFTRSNMLIDSYSISSTRAPNILQEPESQFVRQGSNALFRVRAAAVGNATYQWQKDGVAIAHGTNATLAITNAQFSDEGQYSVAVSTEVGSVASQPARLTIAVRAGITLHPLGQSVAEGGTASFSIEVTGSLPITYLWRRNGVTYTNFVLNQRTCFLTLRNVSASLAGDWRVAVTNHWGTALPPQSNNATLTVLADTDGDGAPDTWESARGFDPNNASDGVADADGDGASNADEFGAGTDPKSAASVLRIQSFRSIAGNAHIQFGALSNRTYAIQERLAEELAWQTRSEIPAVSSNRNMEIVYPMPQPKSLYRLSTPR